MDSWKRWIAADIKAVERRTVAATDGLSRELGYLRDERRADTRVLLDEIRALREEVRVLRGGSLR